MSDEYSSRQAAPAGADFAAIENDLDFIKAQFARPPTRWEVAQTSLLGAVSAAGLVIVCFEPIARW